MHGKLLIGTFCFLFLIVTFYTVYYFFFTTQKLISPVPTSSINTSSYISPSLIQQVTQYTKELKQNSIEVKGVNLLSTKKPIIPKTKSSTFTQAFLTQDSPQKPNPSKATEFKTNEEIFLVLESTQELPQNADIFVQSINTSEVNIEYKVIIKKGLGFLSLATNLPEGKYRLFLASGDGGYTIQFSVKS